MDHTVLSLCSGYAGLDIGLHAALGGGRTLGYVEREAYAASVLLARMEEQGLEPAPIWCGNLEECDYSAFHGVGWITAGFPCQPFSTAGKRLGQDDERWLWDDIVRVIREVQPRWCLFENVPGLVRLGLGPVLRDLAVLGFDAEWGVFSAAQVGASHKRERVFILAKRWDGVDDSGSGRHGHPEREVPAGRDAAVLPGEQLADADRCERRPAQGQPDARHDGRHDARGRGKDLADAGRELLEGGREPGAPGEWDDRPEQREPAFRPLFAPGPVALDVWARVLAQTPQVEPSLCRMDDGTARWLEYRQDRLRALGNGVVPLQAAVAVRVLAERAGWDLDG